MVERPELDLDALTAPIAPDRPAGDDLPYEVSSRLDEYRKEVLDPSLRDEDQKPANWAGAEELARDTLLSTSKHLLPAVRLTEALTKRHHFGGLVAGLRLVRRLVDDCWDRLNPPVAPLPPEDDPGFEEARDAQESALGRRLRDLDWLDSQVNKLAWQVPVLGDPLQFTLLDYRKSIQREGMEEPPPEEEFHRALRTTPVEQFRQVMQDLADGNEELGRLAQSLEGKLPEAPSFQEARQTLEKLRLLAGGALKAAHPEATVDPSANGTPTGEGGEAPSPGAPVARPDAAPVATREAAYRQLGEIAATLKRLEPHSPIPYLLERAISWGKLDFPDLLREMVRDVTALADIDRLVGIPEGSRASSGD